MSNENNDKNNRNNTNGDTIEVDERRTHTRDIGQTCKRNHKIEDRKVDEGEKNIYISMDAEDGQGREHQYTMNRSSYDRNRA